MPNNSRDKINEDEKKIINELSGKGKDNIVGIAKKLGFSRQKVWRIIKRLENNNIIWGYCAVVDYEKIDMHHYVILFTRSAKPLNETVQKKICKERLDDYAPDANVIVNDVLFVSGKYNWVVCVTASGTKMLKLFCDSLMRKFGEYLTGYDLLETIVPVRKMCIKNPSVEENSIFF